jgi:hypothetical protein
LAITALVQGGTLTALVQGGTLTALVQGEAVVAAGRGGGLGKVRKRRQQIKTIIPEETIDFKVNIFIQAVQITTPQENKITITPTLHTILNTPIQFEPMIKQATTKTRPLLSLNSQPVAETTQTINLLRKLYVNANISEYSVLHKPSQTNPLPETSLQFEPYHGTKIIEIAEKLLNNEEIPLDVQTDSFFTFSESEIQWRDAIQDNPRFEAFTSSSSFVGNVRYDSETQEMSMVLNGKRYTFCNVPKRKFEALRGAGSVGAAFNREIKGQHDC